MRYTGIKFEPLNAPSMVTQQFDPRDADISLFREPEIIVNHLKHELHHGSQHGSACPTNNC